MQFDFQRFLKYLLEGLAVSVAAFYIPKRRSDLQEVVLLGLVASVTFALLDLFAPSVGKASRFGAGLGVGLNLAGTNLPVSSMTGGEHEKENDTDTNTDADSTE